MVPAGGHKGATLALMVEILAALLTGSLPSTQAGSLTVDDAEPADVGQLFIALSAERFAGGDFRQRVHELCGTITAQPGVRLPGSRRFAARLAAKKGGVMVDDRVKAAIEAIIGTAAAR